MSESSASAVQTQASGRPGLLVIQIDGLSRPLLEELIAGGRMPVIAGLLRSGGLALGRWVPELPPCTPASQAGILHGRNDGIPGFRWYEKEGARLLVANRPHDAAELAARISDGHGLLAGNGASIGNLLTGDAPSSHLTLATIEGDPSGLDRSSRLGGYPLNPIVYLSMAGRMLVDLGRETLALLRDAGPSGQPRIAPGWRYMVERVLSTIPLRILSTALVVGEMQRGRDVVYVDFTGHDEVAHGRGPRSAEARAAAQSIDRSIGIILHEARHASRRYRLVLLSDHGQSWGATFAERYGMPLERLIASLMAPGSSYHGATLPTEYADSPVRLASHLGGSGRLAARITGVAEGRRRYRSRAGVSGHGPEHPRVDPRNPEEADVVVAASGNLALVAFPRIPGRLGREEIERRYPNLIGTLAGHPGVGLVLARSAEGPVAIGARGTNHLALERVDGDDPAAAYGPHAAHALRRLAGFDNVGDLAVLGRLDPERNDVVSFEELVGTHGGLGGWQAEPFIAFPPEWSLIEDPPIGAPALFRQLTAWIEMLGVRGAAAATGAVDRGDR